MLIFWGWIVALLAGFGLYFGVLSWRRRLSPFRRRLTWLFLLFVLLPSIPSAFFIAQLMTQSADVLLMPGMDEALNAGLDALRSQSEGPGRDCLNRCDSLISWDASDLDRSQALLLGHYALRADSVITLQRQTRPSLQNWQPAPEQVEAAMGRWYSEMLSQGDEGRMLVFHGLADSTVLLAVHGIDETVHSAKDRMTHALRVHATLSLLKESMLQQGTIWATAIVIIVVLSLLAAAVANRLSRTISKPVQDLVAGMDRVAEGDLTVEVHTAAKDEFKALVTAFNQMTRDLSDSRQQLIESEKLAAWQGVARQISHEIKNSLTPLAISIRRLRTHFDTAVMPPRVADSLQAMEEELGSMEKLAGEFSQFARLPQANLIETDLNTLVRQSADLVRPALNGRLLKTDLADRLPPVPLDREQIKRLLNNLITNAIEACQAGDGIRLMTGPSPKTGYALLLEISDTGQGMTQEQIERLYEPYFSTKKRGSGLGMTLVKKIVQEHKGLIEVSSEPGQGSTFSLYFKGSPAQTP